MKTLQIKERIPDKRKFIFKNPYKNFNIIIPRKIKNSIELKSHKTV